ncbi:hypothetical protein HAPG_00056 [Halorubrum phage GNf2]|nr:hypothetical protein HAPG_00056 [Halorubrum phage GNf2]
MSNVKTRTPDFSDYEYRLVLTEDTEHKDAGEAVMGSRSPINDRLFDRVQSHHDVPLRRESDE